MRHLWAAAVVVGSLGLWIAIVTQAICDRELTLILTVSSSITSAVGIWAAPTIEDF